MWIFGYGSLVFKADFPYIKKVVGYTKGYERKFWQSSIDHRGVPEKPGRVVTLVPSEDPEHRVYGIAYKIHRKDVEYVIQHLDLREVTGYERVPAEFYPITHHPLNMFEDHSNTTKVTPNVILQTSVLIENQPIVNNNEDNQVEKQILETSLRIRNLTIDSDGTDSGRGSFQEKGEDESDSDSFSLSSDDEDYDTNYENVRYGRPFEAIMYFGSEINEYFIGPSSLSQMALEIFECSGKSGRNRDYLFNLAESMREIHPDAVDKHLKDLEEAVRTLEATERSNSVNSDAL